MAIIAPNRCLDRRAPTHNMSHTPGRSSRDPTRTSSTNESRQTVVPMSHRPLQIEESSRTFISGMVPLLDGHVNATRLKYGYKLEETQGEGYSIADTWARSTLPIQVYKQCKRLTVISQKCSLALNPDTPLTVARSALDAMLVEIGWLTQEGGVSDPSAGTHLFGHDTTDSRLVDGLLPSLKNEVLKVQRANSINNTLMAGSRV